jgi:two-component system response regulator PrrA
LDANDSQSKTILLVDDNPDIQTVISISLEHFGYTVVCAASGEEAIASLSTCQPQTAIIDYGLPDTDGIAVGKQIRQLGEGSQQMILILFSGSDDREIQQQADAAGFDAYIVKPIRIHKLLEQLQGFESERAR